MSKNRLWLLTVSSNGRGLTTCVVVAPNGDAALMLAPAGGAWATVPRDVSTTLLGEALPDMDQGIICRGTEQDLVRGLEAQRALDEVKDAMLGLTSRAMGCRALGLRELPGERTRLTEKASAYEHAHELLTEALARAGVQMSEVDQP